MDHCYFWLLILSWLHCEAFYFEDEIQLGEWVLARNRKLAKNLVTSGSVAVFLVLAVSKVLDDLNLGELSNAQYKCEPAAMTKQFDSKRFTTTVSPCLPTK